MRRRLSLVAASVLVALATSPVVAAPPEHTPGHLDPLVLEGVCDFPVRLENVREKFKDTLFGPAPDDSVRFLSRGFFDGTATNVTTGAYLTSKGGGRVTIRFEGDGTVRVDVTGAALFAWYFPGDDVNVEPGLYHVQGHGTEWYAADGSLVRAIVRGHVVDVCEALSG